MSILLL